MLYEAMNKTKRLDLRVSKIIRDYIPPEQSFDREFDKLDISVNLRSRQEFQL